MMALLQPTVLLAMALALSLAGNAVLWRLHERNMREIGRLESHAQNAHAAAQACAAGVQRLQKQAQERQRAVEAALARASREAEHWRRRAEATLNAAPAAPDDLCASALDLSRQKLRERKQ